MNQSSVENFLNRLHLDPSFELKVKGAIVESLAQFDLGDEERELIFSEGIARVELASIKRQHSMGNAPMPKPKKAPPKPKKAPAPKKKPSKPKKK